MPFFIQNVSLSNDFAYGTFKNMRPPTEVSGKNSTEDLVQCGCNEEDCIQSASSLSLIKLQDIIVLTRCQPDTVMYVIKFYEISNTEFQKYIIEQYTQSISCDNLYSYLFQYCYILNISLKMILRL